VVLPVDAQNRQQDQREDADGHRFQCEPVADQRQRYEQSSNDLGRGFVPAGAGAAPSARGRNEGNEPARAKQCSARLAWRTANPGEVCRQSDRERVNERAGERSDRYPKGDHDDIEVVHLVRSYSVSGWSGGNGPAAHGQPLPEAQPRARRQREGLWSWIEARYAPPGPGLTTRARLVRPAPPATSRRAAALCPSRAGTRRRPGGPASAARRSSGSRAAWRPVAGRSPGK
jgi:hypothetical protein